MRLLSEINKFYDMMQLEKDSMDSFFGEKLWPQRQNAPERADIFELWCGTMPFTLHCGNYGFTAVEPADLWNGWNLETKTDAEIVLNARRRHRPRLVVASVECTPWRHFNVHLNNREQPEMLAALQRKAAVFLWLAEQLFEEQLADLGHMFLENPGSSSIFGHRTSKRMLKMKVKCRHTGRVRGLRLVRGCMCAFGATNSTGDVVRKDLGFIVDEDLAPHIQTRCRCVPRKHAWLEGREMRFSMIYPDMFVHHVLQQVFYFKQMEHWMLGVLDSGHTCIEPFFVGAVTGFTDITREDAAWHPIFDMNRPILDMVKRPSFDLHYNHEVFILVKRLAPWRLTKVQISRAPKANRLHNTLERLESPHRAAILLYNDGTIEYQVEKLADLPGSHQRFRRPVFRHLCVWASTRCPGRGWTWRT